MDNDDLAGMVMAMFELVGAIADQVPDKEKLIARLAAKAGETHELILYTTLSDRARETHAQFSAAMLADLRRILGLD